MPVHGARLSDIQTDGAARLNNPAAINIRELYNTPRSNSVFTNNVRNNHIQANQTRQRVQVDLNNTSYGFYRYDEVNINGLSRLNLSSNVMGKPEAINKLNQLISEAKSNGIIINVNYGFRSIEEQRYLFYEQAQAKGQTQDQRAKSCSPPGFSEHHTGYAFDISPRSQDYAWLIKNAPKYGFEMSYPQGNHQGVNYEPWHWRYVGNQEAKNIFKYARTQAGIVK